MRSFKEYRDSYNLYNYKDTITVGDGITTDENGWITVNYDNTNGTSAKYLNYYTNDLPLKTSTNYNIIVEIKEVSGDGLFYVTSQYVEKTGRKVGQFEYSKSYNFNILSSESICQLVTISKDIFDGVMYGLRSFIQFNAGQKGSITFRISVLEDTTITSNNFEYEPHGEKILVRDGFETFKESINSNGKQISASFELLGVTITDDLIVKVNPYFDSANSLLGTCMKCVEIELQGLIPVLVDSEINNLKFGVKSDGEYDYINYGTYIVNKYEWDIENMSTTLLCYDKMIQSMIPYDLTIDYSNGDVTVLNLLQTICDRLGWTLGTTEFTNSNVIIDEEKYDNTYTFRSILEEIGQVAGGKIAFKDDGIVYVLYPNKTNEVIDESNLKTLTIGKRYDPVNSLVIARTPQEDNIYRQDEDMINSSNTKNKINLSNFSTMYCTVENVNNSLIVTPTDENENPVVIIHCNLLPGIYYLNLNKVVSGINVAFFDENNNKILSSNLKRSGSFELTSKATVMKINTLVSVGEYDLKFEDLYINEGTDDLGYEEFKHQGVIEVKIENNQLMDSHREDFIDNLFDRLKGLTFYTYELESYGIGYLELYDLFTMKTHDDKEYSCLFLYDNLEIGQGVSENSKAESPEETETDYKVASESDRVLNKTILQVDKQDQEIRALITNTQNISNDIGSVKEGYNLLTQQVEQTMTATQVETLISETINNGIDSVTTSTGYTFDKNGLHISKTGEEMENTIDNTGIYVERDDENVLTANNEGVTAINLTARQYLTIGKNSRLEDYLENRTACFHIGGDN